MKNIKLIKLLKTFMPAEFKKFRDFVKSPYFNKNKNVIKLNEQLAKFYPDFEGSNLDEKILYRLVFKGGTFDYFRIKNLISDLYNLAVEFLKHQPNMYTRFYKDHNMLVEMRSRKLWTFHKKAVKALTEKFENTIVKDSAFLYDNYLLTMEYHLSNVLEKPNSIGMIYDEFLSFYEYSLLNLLKFYNLMMHISKENNIKLDMKMLEDVISYAEKNPASSNPAIESYKNLVLLAYRRDEKYFFYLKDYFLLNYRLLSYEDAYYINMYLSGYCADKFNIDGDRRFIKESCDLLEFSFEKKMVTLGELMYPNFINYVKVFTRAGRTDLARRFIAEFSGKLPLKLQQSCINLANAYTLFYENKYPEALSLISKVNLPWIIMKIQVKIMQLELYYHLGYYEELRNLTDNFRKSLTKEESISELYKESLLSFINNLTFLLNINDINERSNRKEKLFILKRNIRVKQPNHFGVRFWLEDRIIESEKNIC